MDKNMVDKIANVIKVKIRIILISGLFCSVMAYLLYVLFVGVKYEAVSKIFVGKEKFVGVTSDYNTEEISFYQRVLATFKEISRSTELLNSTIENSGIDINESSLAKALSVNVVNKTQIMEFRVTRNKANEAYDLLYSYMEQFIKTSKTYFKNSDIYVIEQPYVRVASNRGNNLLVILLSFSFGALVCIAVLICKNLVFNTVYNKETLEELTTISCIGIIPNDIEI